MSLPCAVGRRLQASMYRRRHGLSRQPRLVAMAMSFPPRSEEDLYQAT